MALARSLLVPQRPHAVHQAGDLVPGVPFLGQQPLPDALLVGELSLQGLAAQLERLVAGALFRHPSQQAFALQFVCEDRAAFAKGSLRLCVRCRCDGGKLWCQDDEKQKKIILDK